MPALLALVLALAWSGLLGAWHLAGRATVLDRLEAPLLDLRFNLAGPRPAPDDIVIVAIDDATVAQSGIYPLPRSTVTALVDTIARYRPRAIGLDLLFFDKGADAADRALAAALERSGTIIAAAALFARGPDAALRDRRHGDIPVAARVLWPNDVIAGDAPVGLVNIATDNGGTPRHVPLLVRGSADLLPSFALLLAARAAEAEPVFEGDEVRLGTTASGVDLGRHLPLRFYGPRGTISTVPAEQILHDERLAGQLAGKIVIIGTTAIGTGDTFATPYDPVLPGVEVLATAVGHLLAGDGLVRGEAIRRIDVAAAAAVAVLAALVLSLAPWGIGIGVVVLTAAAWLAVAIAAFAHGIWLSAALPLAAMAPVIPIAIAGRQITDRLAQRRLTLAKQALALFQPPALASLIAADPHFLAEPRTQPAAVLFVDLSGFTLLSERLGPAATRTFLKDFHGLVSDVVTAHGGVVMNYMGDGAMSVFGLPEPAPADAANALAAAGAAIIEVRRWLATRPECGPGSIDLRAGVHCGEVVFSRLGASDHQHITVAGDSVNVASRLLEVAKQARAALVASDDVIAAAGAAAADTDIFEDRRTVTIRGRRQPLAVRFRWVRT
ncbi:adenylate/guanylate cyclase domain-containing protein [Chelatococcus reniformis]|uniref:Adenylate/guanylate cyclase domain-containing protein n=2 Tax=Chelatococcus reniformis TaxID=1494448 RepID=A0A916XDY6_9HYPH|nr:adenylate/guanylate cyclase domain-containing protein [Chelatococcus reniformis]